MTNTARTALLSAFALTLLASCNEQYGQPPPGETGRISDAGTPTNPDSAPDPALGAEDPSGENKGTNIQRPEEDSAGD